MRKFEYKSIRVFWGSLEPSGQVHSWRPSSGHHLLMEEELREMGYEGWELVGVIPEVLDDEQSVVGASRWRLQSATLLFKRLLG